MDFRNLSRLNVLMNIISGNFLPMTKKALRDGTVNAVNALEIFTLRIYFHCRKNLIRRLIEQFNRLIESNETLRGITSSTMRPIEKPLRVYTVGNVIATTIWTLLPFLAILRKNEFYYSDYQIPGVISKEPFSINIFITGVILQSVAGGIQTVRKISFDLYTMHFIILLTAQYKYLRVKFATIFEQECGTLKGLYDDIRENVSSGTIKREMRLLIRHYGLVVAMAAMSRKLFSPNIVILYLDNVFRFCFLSLMFVMSDHFERFLIVIYSLGALTQFYLFCYSVQELVEASKNVADDVIYKNWYLHDMPLQRSIVMMILTNKLECKLCNLENINLTLPSFISILNQAYSVCLLFLRIK
ncbi:uncharacterized protein LOC122527671 [Frieseomelitta varia]|uniref:uncharacterized protein LOC122527671 n=1 Tax=Frieseomelitta varia TaxID=561572 RepID=UPI001CB691E8|nr:uncharacterized protein LOC122527671 [Frieseomelitta varia]